ncbi:coiled-coil domain-containing protein 117 isoform X4 [Synchiropus splendidus]|uniref:coiled-coil domain-containing protein 117 isoform X4 n=1 Tax=Synchiropus splendidus TaxID=270530 RepID=UPI00237DE486|nr:coiled-coil domain-containing protein 117 isoform X4 [Synchiropus splendidus]
MEWTAVHHARAPTHELGLCAFPGHTSLAELDPGPAPGPAPAAQHPQPASLSGSSWEARCLRKHRRRRSADEGCLAKRRRLAAETQAPTGSHSHSHPGLCGARPQAGGPRAEPSCLEMEAAQRKLREIESRITLEDDDEDPDLEVEPAPRRPVLVLSDSLKEGLQRGMGDILPHTVAQSVSHSCMELVLWRPPEDPFCRRLKGSLHKQRKQQTAVRQSPAPPRPPTPAEHVAPHSGEEDMEMEL